MTVQRADDDHYWLVANRLLAGRVIPFLGAGANLCDRPDETPWSKGRFLPSGFELAKYLGDNSRYPSDATTDLLQVSQYVDAVLGEQVLYEYLHSAFDADYPPTGLHVLLAAVGRILREREQAPLVVLTTNYDDALERAFEAIDEPYETLWYEAKKGDACGYFIQRRGDKLVPIRKPNETLLPAHTVILKLHGAIDRADAKGDSYVITEDNYIDYLTRADIAGRIPVTLRERMENSHLLFLGYSLRDWNLRVILNRIWGRRSLDLKSWAVQREQTNPRLSEIEQRLWRDRGDVDLVYVPLQEYVANLRGHLGEDALAA
jgi:SIR2-like domain